MNDSVSRLVVCGTDTDVGKTVVSAWLVQGLQASYWKPVQSGLDGGGDRERVRQLLNLPPERMLPEAYAFQEPVSPTGPPNWTPRFSIRASSRFPTIRGP